MTSPSATNDNETMKKKPCRRNPSGIPPMSFDSEEDSSSDAALLSTVVSEGGESNYSDTASNRDPPVAEKAPSSDTIKEENDTIEKNDGDDQEEQQEEPPAAPIPTTDELPPRVIPPAHSTRGDVNETTTSISNNVLEAQQQRQDPDTNNDSNSNQKEESSPQERLQMPPNIIKAALQEEVQHSSNNDAPEMVPEKLENEQPIATIQDEKKSDEKSDAELMPPPPPQQQQVVYRPPPMRSLSEQESFGQSSVHSALPPFPDPAFHIQQQQQQMAMMGYATHQMVGAPPSSYGSTGGRRKIILRLQQDAPQPSSHVRRPSFFFRQSSASASPVSTSELDRGTIAVSWFEGTTSAELQEHVRKSLIRKMGFKNNIKLHDLRIIDTSTDPPEEIVLSPFIPDGSRFLLRFSTKEKPAMDRGNFASRYLDNQIASTAPESPSAAPSPHHSSSNLLNLSEEQLATLGAKLKGLDVTKQQQSIGTTTVPSFSLDDTVQPLKKVSKEDGSRASTAELNEEDVMMMDPDDQIEARMRQLTDLLINESRRGKREPSDRRQEKKQVIFVMANYFVLFLSLIAIMAEIQSRAPRWLEWAERNLESVQSCATDQESLFKCVSNGDFSGLLAAIILWFGRSAATRRIFLFGFETPKRLWTVVYESLVTSFCWGISYMFIRRGMNPDTRQNFLQKYWKDAVYGSLAGFNASFLKAVLKNLVPQEALEDALQERHIKILSFLPSFH